MKTDNMRFRDDDVVVLSDSAAADGKFAFLLVFGGIACVSYGTKNGLTLLQVLGIAAFAGAVLIWLRRLWWRESLVLNPAGLCAQRRRRTIAMIPADAIREVVLAEKGYSLELRLRFDQNAVPVLPAPIKRFNERWKKRPDQAGRGRDPDIIVLGRVSLDPEGFTLQKAFKVHRLVEDNGIAEWRRITDQ